MTLVSLGSLCHLLTCPCSDVVWGGKYSNYTRWGNPRGQAKSATLKTSSENKLGLQGSSKQPLGGPDGLFWSRSLSLLESMCLSETDWPSEIFAEEKTHLFIYKIGLLRTPKPNDSLSGKFLPVHYREVVTRIYNATLIPSSLHQAPRSWIGPLSNAYLP